MSSFFNSILRLAAIPRDFPRGEWGFFSIAIACLQFVNKTLDELFSAHKRLRGVLFPKCKLCGLAVAFWYCTASLTLYLASPGSLSGLL